MVELECRTETLLCTWKSKLGLGTRLMTLRDLEDRGSKNSNFIKFNEEFKGQLCPVRYRVVQKQCTVKCKDIFYQRKSRMLQYAIIEL